MVNAYRLINEALTKELRAVLAATEETIDAELRARFCKDGPVYVGLKEGTPYCVALELADRYREHGWDVKVSPFFGGLFVTTWKLEFRVGE